MSKHSWRNAKTKRSEEQTHKGRDASRAPPVAKQSGNLCENKVSRIKELSRHVR